jgi:hypothetical protein
MKCKCFAILFDFSNRISLKNPDMCSLFYKFRIFKEKYYYYFKELQRENLDLHWCYTRKELDRFFVCVYSSVSVCVCAVIESWSRAEMRSKTSWMFDMDTVDVTWWMDGSSYIVERVPKRSALFSLCLIGSLYSCVQPSRPPPQRVFFLLFFVSIYIILCYVQS